MFKPRLISIGFITGIFIAWVAPSSLMAQKPASSPDTLRMDAVVRYVVQHNDRVAAARFMEKSANDKIGPAGAWEDPMLMVGVTSLPTSGSFTAEDMTMKMIGLSQKIPYAGEKGLEKKAANSQAEAAGADTRQTEIDLATAARSAYLNLYYRQQALGFINAQREIQNDLVTSTIKKLGSDKASQADVAAAQADLWRLDSDILSAQQDIYAAFNELYALLGQERPAIFPVLADPNFAEAPANLAEWLTQAQINYPPLLRARKQAEGFGYSARAAGRMRWPMLELEGSYGVRRNGPPDPMTGLVMKRDNMISLQANISLPIFSGRSQRKMASSMNAMKLSSEAEANQIWRDAKADLQTIYSNNDRLTQSLKLYRERIIPADEDAYRSAFAGYESNRVSFTSLLDYATNIYRDRLTANQIAYQLGQNMVQAARFISNTDQWR